MDPQDYTLEILSYLFFLLIGYINSKIIVQSDLQTSLAAESVEELRNRGSVAERVTQIPNTGNGLFLQTCVCVCESLCVCASNGGLI